MRHSSGPRLGDHTRNFLHHGYAPPAIAGRVDAKTTRSYLYGKAITAIWVFLLSTTLLLFGMGRRCSHHRNNTSNATLNIYDSTQFQQAPVSILLFTVDYGSTQASLHASATSLHSITSAQKSKAGAEPFNSHNLLHIDPPNLTEDQIRTALIEGECTHGLHRRQKLHRRLLYQHCNKTLPPYVLTPAGFDTNWNTPNTLPHSTQAVRIGHGLHHFFPAAGTSPATPEQQSLVEEDSLVDVTTTISTSFIHPTHTTTTHMAQPLNLHTRESKTTAMIINIQCALGPRNKRPPQVEWTLQPPCYGVYLNEPDRKTIHLVRSVGDSLKQTISVEAILGIDPDDAGPWLCRDTIHNGLVSVYSCGTSIIPSSLPSATAAQVNASYPKAQLALRPRNHPPIPRDQEPQRSQHHGPSCTQDPDRSLRMLIEVSQSNLISSSCHLSPLQRQRIQPKDGKPKSAFFTHCSYKLHDTPHSLWYPDDLSSTNWTIESSPWTDVIPFPLHFMTTATCQHQKDGKPQSVFTPFISQSRNPENTSLPISRHDTPPPVINPLVTSNSGQLSRLELAPLPQPTPPPINPPVTPNSGQCSRLELAPPSQPTPPPINPPVTPNSGQYSRLELAPPSEPTLPPINPPVAPNRRRPHKRRSGKPFNRFLSLAKHPAPAFYDKKALKWSHYSHQLVAGQRGKSW